MPRCNSKSVNHQKKIMAMEKLTIQNQHIVSYIPEMIHSEALVKKKILKEISGLEKNVLKAFKIKDGKIRLLEAQVQEMKREEVKYLDTLTSVIEEKHSLKRQLEKKLTSVIEEKHSLKRQLEKLNEDLEIRMKQAPECPICFESMQPPKKIKQCVLGHLTCLECTEKLDKIQCPTCRQKFSGRAIAMEQFLRTLFDVE